MLTILGLGPGDPQLLTREAWDILSSAREVYLRTRKHPTVAGLPATLALHDFDELYEHGDDFAQVYARITAAVIAAAQQGDIIYAVPGHPLVGEATVHAILARARELHLATRIVAGLSFIEPVLAAIAANPASNNKSVDPLDGLQICDALELAALHHPSLNPDKPALIAQVYSRAIASDVKLTLMNQYPPEHEVWIVRAAEKGRKGEGRKGEQEKARVLLLLTSAPLHHLSRAASPPLPRSSARPLLCERSTIVTTSITSLRCMSRL